MSWLFLAWIVGIGLALGFWWAFLSFALHRFYYGCPPQVPMRRLWPGGAPERQIFDEPRMWVNGRMMGEHELRIRAFNRMLDDEWVLRDQEERKLRVLHGGTRNTPTTPAA